MQPIANGPGVYLIHISRTKHYVGYSEDPKPRLWKKRPKPVIQMPNQRSRRRLGMRLVRTWAWTDRNFEKKVKRVKNYRNMCPRCNKNWENHMPHPDIFAHE